MMPFQFSHPAAPNLPPQRHYEAERCYKETHYQPVTTYQVSVRDTAPAEVVPTFSKRNPNLASRCFAIIILYLLSVPALVWASDAPRPRPVNPVRSLGVDERLRLPLPTSFQTQAQQRRTFRQFASSTSPAPTDNLGADGPRQLTEAARQHIAKARSVLEKIRQTKNYVSYLDGSTPVELPVGLRRTLGGVEYVIGVSAIRLLPTHAEFDAYIQIQIPQSAQPLTFMGQGLKFSRSGGIVGGTQLSLVGDFAVNQANRDIQVILKGISGSGPGGNPAGGNPAEDHPVGGSPAGDHPARGTFVRMDCDGYQDMQLDAELVFSRNLIVPEAANGSLTAGRVATRFTQTLTDWNDLLLSVSLPSFQLAALPGFGFTVNRAILDMSDVQSAPAMNFPKGYALDPVVNQSPQLWRGVYLQELSVRLPEHFRNRERAGRLSFSANDVLIDHQGFSGLLTARNLLTLEQGSMSGWSFSVTDFSVELMAGRLVGAGFGGEITVPVVSRDSPFAYEAFIRQNDEYVFALSPPEAMEFSLWQAGEVAIYPESSIEIKLIDGAFRPIAHLHGNMSVAVGETKLSLGEITFLDMTVQTEAPYAQVGQFSLGTSGGAQALAGFPLSVSDIGLSTPNPNELALNVTAALSLVGADAGGFGGQASLQVVGQLAEGEGYQDWQYERVDISSIGVDFNTGAVAVSGQLDWFRQDPVYGSGIRGQASFEAIDIIKVDAVALFGAQQGSRYWFVDALTQLPPGSGTGLEIKSFGGGAFFRVRQDDTRSNALGKTLSGITYVPDPEAGLGLRATVDVATSGSEKMFNGDATLSMDFYRGGGLQSVALDGHGYFVTPKVELDLGQLQARAGKLVAGAVKTAVNLAQPRAQMHADLHVVYDHANRSFHGNFDVYVNVARGIVRGTGPSNRAGHAVMHFSPDDWYIHLGTPEDPIGLQILGTVKTASYFVAGTKMPGSPSTPDNVSNILNDIETDYMGTLNAVKSGGGVGFGSRFDMDTGDLSFLAFYARFAAGMGFDVMVKDYGSATCQGSTDPLGINGWYANGQAYAFFDGKIGVRSELFGQERNYEILAIAAAAMLQAKLPNPFWMQGVVGGRFNVLDGLISGNCQFQVVIGEECKIQGGSVLETLEVIADVTPAPNEKKVSVFNAPQAVFNMEIDKVFKLVDQDDQLKSYRIKLDKFEVVNNDQPVAGNLRWNDRHDVVAFNATKVLPSEKSLKARVEISFEEQQNGQWVAVTAQGKKVSETKEVTFETDLEPDYIPMHNVRYSYPVVNQLHFHKDEADHGYIQLISIQERPFQVPTGFRQQGRFLPKTGGDPLPFDFTYNRQNGRIDFKLPAGMQNDQVYAFELVNLPVATPENVDFNVATQRSAVALDATVDSLEVVLKGQQAAGSLDILQEKNLFSAHFKTSRYATFSDKLASLTLMAAKTSPRSVGVHEISVQANGEELFDKFEIQSAGTGLPPLIQYEGSLENDWYQHDVAPLVYNGYAASGLTITRSEPLSWYGVPPTKAVYIYQMVDGRFLTAEAAESGQAEAITGSAFFKYDLPYQMYGDFNNLKNKAAAHSRKNTDSYLKRLVEGSFPGLRSNLNYPLTIRYLLPGTNAPTTEYTRNLYVQ